MSEAGVKILRRAVEATSAARSASGVTQQRRRAPDGPAVGREFRGVFDLVDWTARGTQHQLGWLRQRIWGQAGTLETWWEPRGNAIYLGDRWTTFFDVMALEDSPMRPTHPLFLLGALPRWLTSETKVHMLDERTLAARIDVGWAMFPRNLQHAQDESPLRWFEAFVRLDSDGRICLLAHAQAHRAGGRMNRWLTTQLLDFGCEPPTRPSELDPPE